MPVTANYPLKSPSRNGPNNFLDLPEHSSDLIVELLSLEKKMKSQPVRTLLERLQPSRISPRRSYLLGLLGFLCLTLALWLPDACPHIHFSPHWRQVGSISFSKQQLLSCSFDCGPNLYVLLCRAALNALVPSLTVWLLSCCSLGGKRSDRNRGFGVQLLPINANVYAICLTPYIVRFAFGLKQFAAMTLLAYEETLPEFQRFDLVRVEIYLIHLMQIAFAVEMLLLWLQGMAGLWHAFVAFCVTATTDDEDAADQQSINFLFIPAPLDMDQLTRYTFRLYCLVRRMAVRKICLAVKSEKQSMSSF